VLHACHPAGWEIGFVLPVLFGVFGKQSLMENPQPKIDSASPKSGPAKRVNLIVTLILGLLPTLIILVSWLLRPLLDKLFQSINPEFLFLVAGCLSIFCAIRSSVPLLRRKTWPNITGGILLIFLNGGIGLGLWYLAFIFYLLHGMFG
jgi:hypothetical protein